MFFKDINNLVAVAAVAAPTFPEKKAKKKDFG